MVKGRTSSIVKRAQYQVPLIPSLSFLTLSYFLLPSPLLFLSPLYFFQERRGWEKDIFNKIFQCFIRVYELFATLVILVNAILFQHLIILVILTSDKFFLFFFGHFALHTNARHASSASLAFKLKDLSFRLTFLSEELFRLILLLQLKMLVNGMEPADMQEFMERFVAFCGRMSLYCMLFGHQLIKPHVRHCARKMKMVKGKIPSVEFYP